MESIERPRVLRKLSSHRVGRFLAAVDKDETVNSNLEWSKDQSEQ